VRQFVYFSVLQPLISSLRHHWNKRLPQEYLIASGVSYTVLHRTIFMQIPVRAVQSGTMAAPYSPDQPMSVVDMGDVADTETDLNPALFGIQSDLHSSEGERTCTAADS
jgi:uncharacterized protein YbjT (DUF2867 family)